MSVHERISGRRVVASVSGGKDSAAMCLALREMGVEHERVFMDTGWEHPATYEYLRGELTRVVGPITEIRSELGGMADVIRKKGMFPSRVIRFCTQQLKVFPFRDYARSLGSPIVNAVGIRAAESRARSCLPEWEPLPLVGEGSDTWRPLITWSEQDVIDIHKRHGLAPNPLYLQGASRVGCWPCIFARKKEILFIAENDPARIEEIRRLEDEVSVLAEARYAAKGETFDSLGYSRPAWFQAQGAMRSDGKDGRNVPIDEVLLWAKTARGGRQFELFAATPSDAGCVRWGMCDRPEANDPDDSTEEAA